MKYALLDTNGNHITESRTIPEGRLGSSNPQVAARAQERREKGYGCNRNCQEQKALRVATASANSSARANRSTSEQIGLLQERGGFSARERVRLAMSQGDAEYANSVLEELFATSSRKLARLAWTLRQDFNVPEPTLQG